ncbi:uncharacterized protein LOC108903417 isoform X2 [Anoplophora glabripennis]|uniref:uncharacterized protein LOC108903417 isoform X2 n=1 Tax=Anoplophora glabripennis TaxID=217634 RepID=UPI000874BCFB|nr:uncharacterized protein LOC108903417 isoform X2 [Anoplophora glabripennis]
MAETTQFVSRISVKDLISAFESKSETVRVEFSRPRARSFGNVLNKNVIVRINEFVTLEDVEKGLIKLETDLNFYEVYNKAKHVAFQEQFFNILTSIANIENDDEDAPTRKKRLISRTQTLVSFLNQKLPTNINQVIETKPSNQYKYTTYADHIQASPKSETKTLRSVDTQSSTDSSAQPKLYVESNSTLDVTDSGEEYIVSVKKLKETFQHQTKTETDGPPKQERVVKVNQKVAVTKSVTRERPKPEEKKIEEQSTEEVENNRIFGEKVESVSVTKLRSLFEQRSSSRGLEIITVENHQLTRDNFGGSVQNISDIPYTERNLGNIRLKSVLELSRENSRSRTVIENNSEEESTAESDVASENEDESNRIEEISTDNQEPVENNLEQHVHVHNIIKEFEDIRAKHASIVDWKENKTKDTVPNGKATFTSERDNYNAEEEHVSNLQGFEEEEVNYSEASTEDVIKDEIKTREELTFKGVDEVEVSGGMADSKNIREEENIATLQVDAEDVSQPISTSDNPEKVEINETTHELSFEGYDEEEVNQGTTSIKNVHVEEIVAKFEAATDDLSQSTYTSEIEMNDDQGEDNTNKLESNEYHVSQGAEEQISENTEDSSIFSSLHDLEDEREQSLIDEVIEKIDVEQTLANADLVVNPEDLINADDEFEKLLENSQSGK